MKLTVTEELFAYTIGQEALRYIHSEPLALSIESQALQILSEIKLILDDRTLDDPECFHRIDAIVNTFHAHGIRTSRHDWG